MHQRSLPPHHEVQSFIDDATAILLVHALQVDHVFARTRCRLKFEGNRLATFRRFHPVDLLQLLHAALHLRGMRCARFETLDEFDFLGQHSLLALEPSLLLLLVLRPLLFVKRIVARIASQ